MVVVVVLSNNYIIYSYTQDKWKSDYSPTIYDTYSYQIKVDEILYSVEIIDTAGQGISFFF